MRRYAYRRRHLLLFAGALDRVGDALFSHRLATPAVPRDTLAIRLDGMGDVIQTLPFFDALGAAHPTLRVDVLTNPAGEQVLQGHPAIGHIHVWSCPWFSGGRGSLGAFRTLVRLLRDQGYQCAVDLRGDLRILTAMWWAGIPVRVGYGATGGGFLLTHERPWDPEEPASEKALGLAALLGAPAVSRVPRLPGGPPPPWSGPPRGRPFLVLHPDAGTPSRRWPARHFARLSELLLAGHPTLELVLVGADPAATGPIKAAVAAARLHDLGGRTDLAALRSLLAASAGLITNDSGPAHLAAALDRPVWILWSGAARPSAHRPAGPRVHLFTREVPCAPCLRPVCPVPGHPCLVDLPPEEVSDAVLEALVASR